MNKLLLIYFIFLFIPGCQNSVEKYGKQYQNCRDVESLEKALEQIYIGTDTSEIKKILGEPIDFGFDYRYLTNAVGENGCQIGAVLGIDSSGKVSSKSIFEICE